MLKQMAEEHQKNYQALQNKVKMQRQKIKDFDKKQEAKKIKEFDVS